jgi:hypothetical protein
MMQIGVSRSGILTGGIDRKPVEVLVGQRLVGRPSFTRGNEADWSNQAPLPDATETDSQEVECEML